LQVPVVTAESDLLAVAWASLLRRWYEPHRAPGVRRLPARPTHRDPPGRAAPDRPAALPLAAARRHRGPARRHRALRGSAVPPQRQGGGAAARLRPRRAPRSGTCTRPFTRRLLG